MNQHRGRLPTTQQVDANPVKQQAPAEVQNAGLVVIRPNTHTQHPNRVPRPVPTSQFAKLYLATAHDPQYVFPYVEDIHRTMRDSERKYQIQRDYMQQQPKITAKFREVLVDWLSSVRGKYSLKPETFALAISLLDRYLEKRQIEKNLLQLLGCTCLWVASKYEEIYPPELQDLVLICESNFKRETFIMMERNLLTLLDFSITVPYAIHFAERYIQALPPTFNNQILTHLSTYLIEINYQNYSFVSKLPSAIAAAAVSLALFLTQQPHWHRNLEIASEYSFESIHPIFSAMWQHASDINAQHRTKKEIQSQHERIRQAYAQQGMGEPPQDKLPRVPKAFDSVLRLHSTEACSQAPNYVAPFEPSQVPTE